MISGKQSFNILQYAFSGNNNNTSTASFIEPTATFEVTPEVFSLDTPPSNLDVTAVITANSGVNIQWEIFDGVSVSPVLTGTNLVINTTLPTPTANTTYTIVITYIGGNQELQLTSSVLPFGVTLIGQLPLPGDNIVLAADLTPFLGGLSTLTETEALELFTIEAIAIGRLVIVVPDAYGTLVDISDENDISALNEFNIVNDISNNRKIYILINTVISGDYKYKLVF